MKLSLLVFVLSVSYALAQPHISMDENELSEIGRSLDRALKTLDTSSLLELDLTNDLQAQDGRRHCAVCVRFAAEHIMRHVVEHIKHHCETTKCPFERKQCEIMARHKKVVFGYLLAKVDPAKLGFFFCAGHGDCGRGDRDQVMNSTTLEPLDPRMNIVLDQPLELPASIFAEGLNWVNVTSLTDLPPFTPPTEAPEPADPTTVIVDGDADRRRHHRCFECVGCASAHVMRHVVDRIVHFCRDAKCPVVKRHCAWARQHREVVFGILLARVEPHKFGFGACVALGRCGHR